MPSARRTTALAVLTAALGALALSGAGQPPSSAQSPQPVPFDATQNGEPMLRLDATLWAEQLSVPALPGQFVEAEVRRPNGTRLLGFGSGGNDGRATLDLFNDGDGRGGPTALQAGDTVRIAQSGRRPLEIVVPPLSVAVDTATDRVTGTAPAGATVAVLAQTEQVGPDGAVLWRDVPAQTKAGPDGAFAIPFAGEGVDLPTGRTRGRVWIETADHDRFTALFVDARLDAALGAYEVRGLATPGRRVRGTVVRAGGEPVTLPERTVTGDGAFALGTAGFGFFGPPPPDAHPLAVGDRIDLVVDAPSGTAEATLSLTMPSLTVAIDAGSDAVRGTAPADSAVRVEVTSLDGERIARGVRAGADGSFSVDWTGAADLGPGWLAQAGLEPAPNVSVGAVAVVPQTRVGVGMASVRGLAEPGTAVTVTLRAPNGAQRRIEPAFAGATGRWSVGFAAFLPGADELEVRAGDRIEVATVDGDPQVAVVPTLTALADEDGDTVGGTAAPGARLRVVAGGHTVAATADGAGNWTASFAGRLDLAAPMGGEVWLEGGAFAFYTTWSVVRLNVELGSNFLTGNGPRGRAIDAVLRSPDGKTVATSHGRVFDPSAFGGGEVIIIGGEQDGFYLEFVDITGQQVPIQPGDSLQVTAGDKIVSFVVPPLDGAVFVQDDVVSGRTRAGATVRIRVQRDDTPTAEATTTADANGTFSHRFGPGLDLIYNDFVQLEADVSGHRVTRFVGSPGIQLDLDRASAQGQIAPDARVRIELKRGGAVLAGVETQTGPDGFYWADLHDAAGGRALVPRQGDTVTVTPLEPAGPALTMTLPELTVDADPVANTVGGRASPGGALAILANDNVGDGALGFGQAWPEIAAGGAWYADFVPSLIVRPGLSVSAQYRTPEGHVAVRTRVVPLLNVEHGGANVCGWTGPSGAVSAELRDAGGRVKGGGTGKGAWWDGAFHALLRDPSGAAVTTATSDTVSADLSGTAAQVTLPRLELAMDWATRRLTGHVPRGSAPAVQYPAGRCAADLDPNGVTSRVAFGFRLGFAPTTDGSVDTEVPLPIEAGQGFEVAMRTATGHRVFRQFWRSQVEAHLATARVEGTTNSLAPMSITLKGADGAVKGTASGAAGPSGRFDLSVVTADGRPALITPGDTLTAIGGGDSAVLAIDALTFDWSPGSPVLGTAPAGRALRLTLRLNDGRRLHIARTADAAGRWSFGVDEVPVRGGWTLDDVSAVRVALLTSAGHAVIDQSAEFEAPDAPPPTGTGAIYLPALLAKASFGGGRAAAVDAAPAAVRAPAEAPALAAGDDVPVGVSSALGSIRQPVHKAQAGPRVVHRAHLVVHQAPGQPDRPDHVLVEIRRDPAPALRPRDP